MQFIPHAYQHFAIQHIIDNTAAGLFLGMGLGKTVSALTAIDRLMFEYLDVRKVLVVAPKKVAENTWTDEAAKWDHLNHLRISVVLGDERERKEALKAKADIYVINRENVAWLVGYYQSAFPFDMLVLDELSSFKSSKAIRFKTLRLVRPKVNRVVGLTGTPAPNGLIDLWAQIYLLDMGKRLGKFVTDFRDRFFHKKMFKYIPKRGTAEKIYQLIGDICISMKAEDYLDLPKTIEKVIRVNLSPSEKARYDAFEEERILAIGDIENITAVNSAALSTKLQQFANGAVYDEDRVVHEVHKAKLEALEEFIEAANGEPVIVAYTYQHDCDRIMKYLKDYNPVKLAGPQTVRDWNEGKISVLLLHPASGGHGLNLQFGGHIIAWFGHTWNLEFYQQLNCRLDRQGQTKPVILGKIVVTGTIDEDIVASNVDKADEQDALMNAVKVRVLKYRKKRKTIAA
jgi:SNF2 family DNA or RNA helicase